MKRLFVILALGLGFTSTSQAFIRVEPYVGYEMGNGTSDALKFETKGINAGLRLGWLNSNEKFWAVIDYETTFDASLDYGEGQGRDELKKTIIFGVVGYNFLERPWRVWAGYGMDEWALQDAQKTKFKGTATKFGVGYTRYKPMSINFELFNEAFTEVSDAGGGSDIDMKSTSYMLSVSWPLKY